MSTRPEVTQKRDFADTSDSNELSDVDIGDDEELDFEDENIDENQDLDEDENQALEEEENEEDEDPEDPEDAEDYVENDDNDEIELESQYDLVDMESEESDEASIPVAPKRSARPIRESKKRLLTFYEEDDLLESDEGERTPKKRQAKAKAKTPKRTSSRVTLRAPKKDLDDFTEYEQEYRPNPQKLTERQRAKLEEDPNERYEELMFARMDQQLLALNRKTAKRIETAEQVALRRAENARKRAHYKVKQLEDAKRDTLNKLLKRRATKTKENEADDLSDEKQTLKPRRPVVGHPSLFRWVSRPEGCVFAVSDGSIFNSGSV